MTQTYNIAHGRITKQAVIFEAELGRTFIADLKASGRRIQMFDKHKLAGFAQTQPLLILQRTHGRQRSEMMVEDRCTWYELTQCVMTKTHT